MIRVFATLLLFLLLVACGGDGEEPSGAPTTANVAVESDGASTTAKWAVEACGAVAGFEAENQEGTAHLPASSEGLSVEERKQRSVVINDVWIEAAKVAEQRLRGITPPPDAGTYHDALIAQFRGFQEVRSRVEVLVQAAVTETDLELANAALALSLNEFAVAVRESAQGLAPESVNALRGVTNCPLVN